MNIKTTLVIAAFAVVAALGTPLLTENEAYALHKIGHEPQDDKNNPTSNSPKSQECVCGSPPNSNPSPNRPAQCL